MVLGRPDVWPVDDIALAQAVAEIQRPRAPPGADRDARARRAVAPVARGRRPDPVAPLPVTAAAAGQGRTMNACAGRSWPRWRMPGPVILDRDRSAMWIARSSPASTSLRRPACSGRPAARRLSATVGLSRVPHSLESRLSCAAAASAAARIHRPLRVPPRATGRTFTPGATTRTWRRHPGAARLEAGGVAVARTLAYIRPTIVALRIGEQGDRRLGRHLCERHDPRGRRAASRLREDALRVVRVDVERRRWPAPSSGCADAGAEASSKRAIP